MDKKGAGVDYSKSIIRNNPDKYKIRIIISLTPKVGEEIRMDVVEKEGVTFLMGHSEFGSEKDIEKYLNLTIREIINSRLN